MSPDMENGGYAPSGGTEQDASKQADFGYHRPGRAITAMVLGICSVSLWWYPFITSIPCIIMGIVAIVMAKKDEMNTDPKYYGFLKAAKITGWIGLILASLYTFIMLVVIFAAINS